VAYNSAMPPRRLGCVAQSDHLPGVPSGTIAHGYIKGAPGAMCNFARCAGYLGLDFPLGQRSAGSGEQHEAVVVHPAVYQAGAHGVGDRLLAHGSGQPQVPRPSIRYDRMGLEELPRMHGL
jgi:hypothetical protein